jgi:hypothetical protein
MDINRTNRQRILLFWAMGDKENLCFAILPTLIPRAVIIFT